MYSVFRLTPNLIDCLVCFVVPMPTRDGYTISVGKGGTVTVCVAICGNCKPTSNAIEIVVEIVVFFVKIMILPVFTQKK